MIIAAVILSAGVGYSVTAAEFISGAGLWHAAAVGWGAGLAAFVAAVLQIALTRAALGDDGED